MSAFFPIFPTRFPRRVVSNKLKCQVWNSQVNSRGFVASTGIDSLTLWWSVRAAQWEENEMITVIIDRIASEWSLLKLLIQHESKVSWVYLQQPACLQQ